MTMNAGELDRRVKIEKKSGSRLPSGQPGTTWLKHKDAWANIKTPSGMSTLREQAGDGLTQSISGYSIRVRFDESITNGMRVNYKDKNYYNIIGVKHDFSRRVYTDLICELGGRG
jgi:SPP1 family predicted phage head-tail adaptor